MNKASETASFFKNFSALFSGLVLVQIINFLFSLVLPKYFAPADFAEFGIFTSVVFILIEVVNAKLDIVVMLGKDDLETKKILNAAFTIAVIIFSILLLVELLFLFFLPKIYFLLPFTILLYGIHQPVLVYLNKQEKYAAVNYFRILQVLTTCAVTLLLAFQHVAHALVYGFIAGLTAATLLVLFYYRPKADIQATKEIWEKYDQFPKYGTWSSLLNNFRILLVCYPITECTDRYVYFSVRSGVFQKGKRTGTGRIKKINTENHLIYFFNFNFANSIYIIFRERIILFLVQR